MSMLAQDHMRDDNKKW